jgi:HD-like signal output (HDOD) protein
LDETASRPETDVGQTLSSRIFARIFKRPPPKPAPARPVAMDVGVPRSPVEQFLELRGDPELAPAPDLHDADEVEALAEQVLAAFELNQPVPSASQRVALQVINEVAQPSTAAGTVARLVQQDPALTAAVLKVANSPAYQGTQEIVTLRDAVARLGSTEIGRVAGIAAARTLFGAQVKQEQAYFSHEFATCFEDALATGRIAAALALTLPGAASDQIFLAGILHDIGRSMALRCLATLTGFKGHLPAWLIDATVEKVHVELGGLVHQNWDLPRFLTLVAVRHHETNLPTGSEHLGIHVVRLVSAMVQARRLGALPAHLREEIDSSAKALGLDGFALRALDTQVREARPTAG